MRLLKKTGVMLGNQSLAISADGDRAVVIDVYRSQSGTDDSGGLLDIRASITWGRPKRSDTQNIS